MASTSPSNIPDEAVEAAARAYTHAAPYLSTENAIREALEAAAPHMLAQGWDEGFGKGAAYAAGSASVDEPGEWANPYRKPTNV